jgi:hypothetical protein
LKIKVARTSIMLEITTPNAIVKSVAFEMFSIVGIIGRAEI